MSTYVCEGAIMRCCFGSAPACLKVSAIRDVSLTNARHANIADRYPFENIPSFGICHKDGSHPKPCSPGTMCLWEGGNYDYLIRNYPALLDTSYCKCVKGGIIKFIKDGQTEGEFDMSRNSDGQVLKLREDEEPRFPSELVLDAIEYIPVLGSIVGIGRSAMKGDWAMVGLNAGFLALDVFTVGAGSTLAKIGAKGGAKVVAKTATKEIGKQTVKQVEKEAVKETTKQASEAAVKSRMPFLSTTAKQSVEGTVKGVSENLLESFCFDNAKNIFVSSTSKIGAETLQKMPKIENEAIKILQKTLLEGNLRVVEMMKEFPLNCKRVFRQMKKDYSGDYWNKTINSIKQRPRIMEEKNKAIKQYEKMKKWVGYSK